MKKKYLKSMTAYLIMMMLSVLCLTSSQTAMAQNRNMGGGSSSGGSSAANANSPQKPVMPLTTRSTGNAVSVNGTEHATWADAVTAINQSSKTNFDIVLLANVMDAKTMPNKPCTISGTTTNINFAYINNEGNLTRIQMSAPVTFKNITLQIWQIAANGHALTFDEGVTVTSKYDEITGIRNIWGGTDNSGNVASTNVTIKSGSFGWIYAGSGDTGKTESTHLTIEGGTIYGDIWGGSYAGESTTTNITIKGGIIKSGGVYGGGWNDKVGTTNITIVDGELEGSVFGGGAGEGSEYSVCENTNVTVEGGHIGVRLYGGGSPGQVTGTAKIVVSGGSISGAIFGGGGQYNSVYDYYTTATCQNTDATIGGVTLGSEGIFAGGDAGKVLGKAKLTFTGDITLKSSKTKVYASGQSGACGSTEIILAYDLKDKLAGIAVNTDKKGSAVTNESKLTFKNLGTNSSIYNLPWKIEGFTTVALDNSYLKAETDANCFVSDLAKPTTFKGAGFISPIKIDTKESTTDSKKVLFMAEERPEPTIFTGVNNLNGKKIFRVNKTYHLTEKTSENWKTITMTPTTGDTLLVKLDTTILLSGDKIPTELELIVHAASQHNYALKVKKNDVALTSNPFTVTEDAAITMEVIEYLDLAEQKEDVTIGMKDNKWQYQANAITRSNEPPVYNFNGTIKNTLIDSKTVVIDATAKGALTFESAKINSSTTAAPALTIASGAKVSFSGNLEVKAGEANQYGIVNNGSLTITGAATEINATNTTTDSDKGIKVDATASIVAEADTKLTTSGMANTGTVVVKEGATAETTNKQPLQKTYLVTITNPGNGNKLVLTAGADITVSDQDKVADKTVLTVSGVPASGYTLESITVTPQGGQAATLGNNSTYTMPESEVTFAATFKQAAPPTPPTPPATVYYNVTLPEVEGATTNPVAGEYQVEAWSSFGFILTLRAGYESSSPIVKANGNVVTPRTSDGKYIIKYIRNDMDITIEGIVKDTPTANEEIDNTVKVYAIGSTLTISLPQPETVYIYTLSGLLYKQEQLSAGDTQIQLTSGFYLVKIGNKTYKVIIQ